MKIWNSLFGKIILTFLVSMVPVLELRDAFVTRMEQRALKKSDTVRRARFWGLFLFVAIPLPGTGAWTGSLIAAMLDMRVKEAFPPIALGVVTAGIIVAVVTYGAASLLF